MDYKEFKNVEMLRCDVRGTDDLARSIYDSWVQRDSHRRYLKGVSRENFIQVILDKTTVVDIITRSDNNSLVVYLRDHPVILLEKYPELFL